MSVTPEGGWIASKKNCPALALSTSISTLPCDLFATVVPDGTGIAANPASNVWPPGCGGVVGGVVGRGVPLGALLGGAVGGFGGDVGVGGGLGPCLIAANAITAPAMTTSTTTAIAMIALRDRRAGACGGGVGGSGGGAAAVTGTAAVAGGDGAVGGPPVGGAVLGGTAAGVAGAPGPAGGCPGGTAGGIAGGIAGACAAVASDDPHCWQNALPSGFCAPHFGQTSAIRRSPPEPGRSRQRAVEQRARPRRRPGRSLRP